MQGEYIEVVKKTYPLFQKSMHRKKDGQLRKIYIDEFAGMIEKKGG